MEVGNKAFEKNIGIEIIKPKSKCNDKKCVWHGEVRIRGKILQGIVVSDRMEKTVTVLIPRLFKVKKYERYMKKRSKIKAHNPPCINARVGDIVIIGETRRLSKTKSFVVIAKVKRAPKSILLRISKGIKFEKENETNKS